MKIKILALLLAVFMGIALTGCSYEDYKTNIKLFNEFVSKIMYFYQGNSGGGQGDNTQNDNATDNENQGDEDNAQTQEDFLVRFKRLLNEGKLFTLTKTAQTKYSTVSEEIYFAGSYIYKFSEVIGSQNIISHKLYLDNGLTYSYNGASVTNDKAVDFSATKIEILRDLFSADIAWEKLGNGYAYKKGNYEYYLKAGENENSLEYEIRYSAIDTWAEYKGEVKLFDSLIVDIPVQLKQYL